MNYYDRNNDTGFTLVELLIAMTIGLIILTALSSTFLMQRKIYDVQEQVAEMVQTARAAMDMMTREIRMAGYDPTDVGFDGITYDANQLQIQANINRIL
jgi:type IV pilus assembly protein PilW